MTIDPIQLVRDLYGLKTKPGFKERGGASEDAAKAVAPMTADLRGQAAELYYHAYPSGLTADEAAAKLRVSPFSARPRVSELHQLGLLRKSGERRRNRSCQTATVWVATALLVGERAVAAVEGVNPKDNLTEDDPALVPGAGHDGGAQ